MLNQNQFCCFLIGEGTLPIQCAELLLERGHQPLGIISFERSIENWANEKGISYFHPSGNLVEFLSQKPFDYLFSIVNNLILSPEVLKLPRQYAINFHDAPLPKYAGVNATSWALINREKIYGITWHVMTNLINGGDILNQAFIDIDPKETAFTLNTKCYEAAISSFTQLIDKLSSGKAVAIQQNLNERTYFPPSKRPSAGGLLSFNRCAYDLDALVRALDFGSYSNPLGQIKLTIGGDFIVVSKLEVLDELSQSPPGTITAIEQDFLKVSTISYEIALCQVQTLEGQPLSISDLVKRFELQAGYQFKDVEPELAKRVETFETLIAKHEAFWVERLASLQPITIPYAERTVSSLRQKRYASVKMLIPDEVITFMDEHQPTWNWGEFLFAAFVSYLARIGGTSCFDVGFKDIELEWELVGTAGFFAPSVPCRLEVNFEQSFDAVFEAIREQVALTRQHKTYARDTVVRYPELRKVPELGSEQIFPVVIERVESLDDHQAQLSGELTFIIPEDGKECCLLYNTEVLDSDSVARILSQFATFLQGIVTDSSQHLAYLPILSEEERHKILVEWNDTKADYPKDKCIHQLFEEQVERTPDNVAVVFEDQELTYRELNARANQLALYLQELGVGPEVLVGICVERSLEMVVGLLGILKAGGAYVPLDPKTPIARLSYLLQDAKARVLLTQQQLGKSFSEYEGYLIFLDTNGILIKRESAKNPTSGVTINNLAYVIYTSGSTGKPKGVLVEHRSLGSLAAPARSQAYNVKPDSRVLQFAPLSFSTSVPEIFMTLLVGATLYLAKQESLLPEAGLAKLLSNQAITNVKVTPSLLAAMPDRAFPALQTITVVGEKCSAELVARWATNRQFINSYGATEASISGTAAECSINGKSNPSIGGPIANTQIYILDFYQQLVPIGVSGELYIGGTGIARGYLNQPDLTAERFIANPFSSNPAVRLYKTGDLAYYLPNGKIMLLGRLDNQVKIRGFRIELEEIETVLTQHSTVQDTVVIVRKDELGDKHLVAYVVLSKNRITTVSELRHFLKQKLPDYMIPSAFVFLDTLPLNSNGKIVRAALPAPERSRLEQSIPFVAPHTLLEKQIVDIWSQVLKLELIGIQDNFFELGGHSLLATQVISRLRQELSVEIPVRSLFELPTVAELAKRIETIRLLERSLQNCLEDSLDKNSYEEGKI